MAYNWSITNFPCFVPGLWISAQLLDLREHIEAATTPTSTTQPKWHSSKMRTLISQFIQHSTTALPDNAPMMNQASSSISIRQDRPPQRKKTTIQKDKLAFLQHNPNVRISCISPLYESLYFTVGPTPRRSSGAKSAPMWFTYECAANGASIFETLKQLHGEQEQQEQQAQEEQRKQLDSQITTTSSLAVASRRLNGAMNALLVLLNPLK